MKNLNIQHMTQETDALESAAGDEEKGPSKENLLMNWPLMSSVRVELKFFWVHDTAYSEIFSLWAVSPTKIGGFGYSTDNVGVVLSISGLCLVFHLSLYPRIERILGPIRICQILGIISILLLQSFPFIALLSGLTLTLVLSCASILKNVLSMSVITGLLILQNDAVEHHQRGVANGIAMTAMSSFNALGPAGGRALFSWAQKRQTAAFLPGNHIVFFVLNVIGAAGLLMTFKPFLAQRRRD